jgi:hypothetical protein
LFDAPLNQFRFHFRLLSLQQVDFRFKRSVTRQFDLDSMFSGADRQGMNRAA